MKVSLSASHANCREAIELLNTCDLIYTTQVKNLGKLEKELPFAEIKVIPDCCPDMIEFLKERHKNDEVIGFDTLMQLRRVSEKT